MAMERFTVSMNESDIDLFERKRAEMEMSKSAYIRFLIAEHENRVPVFLKNKELIEKIAELNTSINELVLTDRINDVEKIHICEDMKTINTLMKGLK